MDDSQRERLMTFLAEKRKIDDLDKNDFEKLDELGAGNGGVVTKVRHIPTNLIMARKVCVLCTLVSVLAFVGFNTFPQNLLQFKRVYSRK